MDNLVGKINNYTASGAPSVSELIELQEVARSLKIPRATLEKMIAEAIARAPEKESNTSPEAPTVTNPTYERPDYDSERNSFDIEMNQRREAESIPDRKEIIFNRPEITFPKMEDPFAEIEKVEEIEPVASIEPLPDLTFESEMPFESISDLEVEPTIDPISEPAESIDDIEKRIQEIDKNTAALEQASTEKMEQVQELMKKKQEEASAETQRALEEAQRTHEIEVEKRKVEFEEAQRLQEQERVEKQKEADQQIDPLDNLFDSTDSSEDNLIDLIETIKDSKGGTIEFGDAVDDFENVTKKDEIDDWVANANKEESRRAEEIARRSLKANPSNEDRSFARDDSDYGVPNKLESARSAYTLGIVALVLSILFGLIGGVIGIFAASKAGGDIRKAKENPRSYEPGAMSKLKNARTMAIIAIIISAFYFFRMFLFGFYFF